MKFEEWFKTQYDGLPDPERVKKLEAEILTHVYEIQRLGEEKQELQRLSQAWTDCLYAWQAKE